MNGTTGILNALPPQTPLTALSGTAASQQAGGTQTAGFAETLKAMVDRVNDSQIAGDKAIELLQSGDVDHLHEVMVAVEEADISLRMLTQIRNKALSAYEEIMRMQI